MPQPFPPFAKSVEEGVELRLKVVPGARRSEIVGALGDRLKVRVSQPAESGRANEAVVELLSRWLGSRDVAIVSGHSRPEKTVRVRGMRELPPDALSELSRARR